MKEGTEDDMLTRREFVARGAAGAAGIAALAGFGAAWPEEIVDIHQHTHYSGRSDETLIAHQRAMGVTRSVLLPAGSKLGLDANCYGNDSVLELARRYPAELVFFANEVPDLPEARPVLETYLNLGACGIGEQKFHVDCDSRAIHLVAQIARHYSVPVLLHFQHNVYNTNFLRFHTVLAKYPQVNFIGHAQTWWGNIDRNHVQEVLYPKGRVTPGGYTDQLLSDYPNMYGDLSAGSGLNALTRDEEHAGGFLLRHRGKLLYGSDCDDRIGSGEKCSGSQCLAELRRLVSDGGVLKDILVSNAKRVIPMDRQETATRLRVWD
jgi:predicted TIM-barrel fold metal-dependent hydrolase